MPDSGWHARPVAEIGTTLETGPERRLDSGEAARRLASEGPNALRREEGASALAIFAAQFRSLVVWVLIGAALVSITLGEVLDGTAILAVVLLNAGIGFFQEFRAGRALAALARLAAPRARVVRGGRALDVPAAEIVRGDLLVLEGGDLVAADARLVETAALRTIEASLTGESEPVAKEPADLPRETPLADRRNMVFLPSVSTASATVICTDKTGTLTVGEMTARRLVTPTRSYTVTGEGYDAAGGAIHDGGREVEPGDDPALQTLLETAAGCVDAELGYREGRPVVIGFLWEHGGAGEVSSARNAAFSVLVTAELLRSFGARSDSRTLLEVGPMSNLRLLVIVAASFSLQLAIHHVPVLESVFGTEPVTLPQCLGWIVLGSLPLAILEISKIVRR